MYIKEILIKQKEILENLNILLEKEKEVLIANNGEDLKELVDQKEAYIIELEEIEEKRINKYGNQKITDIEYLSEDKEAIIGLAKALKNIHISIKEKQEINFMLTKQSIEYQDTIIRIIQNTISNSGTVYGRDGRVDGKPQVHTSIDKTV